jgi:TRAP-type C4-dicarboxylate transport system substrate-binding protein
VITRRACLAWAGSVHAVAAAQTPTWRLATGYRETSFHGQNLRWFAEQVAARGGPSIALHANNTLAPLSKIPALLRDGGAEMGEVIMAGLAADMPLAGADTLPFVVNGYADARRLWQHQLEPLLPACLAQGLIPLMAVPWPPQGLYSKAPVQRVEDLAGQRMRTYDATTEQIARWLGATPVTVPMVQVAQALAEGRFDCMFTSAATGVENEVWRHLGWFYEVNAWLPKNLTMVSTKAWPTLNTTQQRAMRESAAEAETRGWAASEEVAVQPVQALRRAGMRVERPSLALRSGLARLGERFSLQWVRAHGASANRVFIPYHSQR